MVVKVLPLETINMKRGSFLRPVSPVEGFLHIAPEPF